MSTRSTTSSPSSTSAAMRCTHSTPSAASKQRQPALASSLSSASPSFVMREGQVPAQHLPVGGGVVHHQHGPHRQALRGCRGLLSDDRPLFSRPQDPFALDLQHHLHLSAPHKPHHWQRDGEGGPAVRTRRRGLDESVVHLHDPVGDPQTQPAAAAGLQLVGVELHALLEELVQVVGAQPRPEVLHGHRHRPRRLQAGEVQAGRLQRRGRRVHGAVRVPLRADGHCGAGAAELEGVGDQVAEHLRQPGRVAQHQQAALLAAA
mmetsp:Transcript_22557/g.30885  ORF Transcript_22557/g.30885 Transcript_22557/m.30885 type:complete len:262 (+) Transcript_22557:3728-4513(+)